MFSRRHPYLFFMLISSAICATAILGISFLVVFAIRSTDFADIGKGGEKVGVIEIAGVITDTNDILHKIKQFREEPSVKAIVLRIDSPGGAVGPSQEIYREIRKTVKSKTVIASMGAVAASGGYYIAAGTDGIVASAGTITGSIGVIMGFTNFQQILHKIGLVPVVVKSGKYKDIGSPVREMTDNEREMLQDLVNKIHRQFVKAVAAGRNIDQAKLEPLADGRIFTGEEAKDLGLVDRIGNFEDAIEWAGRRGGIKGKISVVYAPEKKFSFIKYLTGALLTELSNRTARPVFFPGYLYHPGG